MSVEDKEREFYFNTIQLLMQQNRELITLIIDLAGKQIPPMPPGLGDEVMKMFGPGKSLT